jgi:DNA-binding beta-propeller fold protein YncE
MNPHGLRTLFLVAAAWAVVCSAQPTPKAALLVLSKQDRTLAIVDPDSLRVLSRIPVGEDPHEVIASTDGQTAYVSNYGFGAYHTLAVVDLVGQKRLSPVDLGALRGPHGLTFVQGKVWFTAEAAKAIGSYDPAAQRVDWIMGTGQNRTHMLYVFPDAKRIVTTNVNSATVTILDKTEGAAGVPPGPPPGMAPPPGTSGGHPGPPPTPPGGDWNETVVAVGRGSEGFDITPDGKRAWVANARDGTVSIVDLDAKKGTETLNANVPGANRLKFTPDGKLALVSAGPDLVILDARTHKEVKRLALGHGSGGILVQPDGARAYVAFSPDGFVAVIDLKTLDLAGRIDAGPNPDGLAWAVRQ